MTAHAPTPHAISLGAMAYLYSACSYWFQDYTSCFKTKTLPRPQARWGNLCRFHPEETRSSLHSTGIQGDHHYISSRTPKSRKHQNTNTQCRDPEKASGGRRGAPAKRGRNQPESEAYLHPLLQLAAKLKRKPLLGRRRRPCRRKQQQPTDPIQKITNGNVTIPGF